MRRLTVFYDRDCGFCVYCRHWLARQPVFLELEYMPIQSFEAERRLAPFALVEGRNELLVLSDDGHLYRDGKAFIMALYALREYREWSIFLARPSLLPFARRAFELLSQNRRRLSSFLNLQRETELAKVLETHDEHCVSGNCGPEVRRGRLVATPILR